MLQKELAEKLGTTEARLDKLVAEGLPCEVVDGERQFSPGVVAEWLVDNGYAIQQRVVETRAEVARHFHVSTRTIGYWSSEGMPGKPGAFNLDEIEEWRQKKQGGEPRGVANDERSKMLAVDRQLKELKLQQQLGLVAPVAPWFRRLERRINEAKAILGQLPEMVVAVAVEEGLSPEAAGRMRRRVAEVLDRTYGAIADAASPDDAEIEPSYDDDNNE